MKFRVALAGLIWLMGLGSAAQAQEDRIPWLGTGALFANNQATASCTVANVTKHQILINQVQIFSSDGSPVSIPFDNCTKPDSLNPLEPGRACNQNANMLSSSLLYFCRSQ